MSATSNNRPRLLAVARGFDLFLHLTLSPETSDNRVEFEFELLVY